MQVIGSTPQKHCKCSARHNNTVVPKIYQTSMEYLVPWKPLDQDEAAAMLRDLEGDIHAGHILFQRYYRPIARTIDSSGNTLFILDEESTACAVVQIQWKDNQKYVLGVRSCRTYESLVVWRQERMEADNKNTRGDLFGWSSSDRMPLHFFRGALLIDHSTAIRADIGSQNYSVCPRHWYVDADFICEACRKQFTWTAGEQKAWFEDYFFWIDSSPRHCKTCRADRRHLVSLRTEYDTIVAEARPKNAIDQKLRVIEIVRELESSLGRLPEKMIQAKDLFELQIKKAQQTGTVQPTTRPVVEPEGGDNPQPEAEGRSR